MSNIDQQKLELQQEIVRELLLHLASDGHKLVLAGGACRDWYHGKPAKDFDLLDLNAEKHNEHESYEEACRVTRQDLERIQGVTITGQYDSYRDESGRIIFVVKFQYYGLDFDYIAYQSCPTTPDEQVEEFDSNINMIWYAAAENSLVPHRRFVEVINEEQPIRPLRSLDGEVKARLDYLHSKYPQYSVSEELLNV